MRKVIKSRSYWYHQPARDAGRDRKQVYAGLETPELLARIDRHRDLVASDRECAELIRSLTRSRALPVPPAQVGRVIAALADNGVFRLRAVLVGTVAFQTYASVLGIRIRTAALATEDIDVAQAHHLSQQRVVNREKARKDITQAEILLDALTTDRPGDVRDMWDELAAEGRKNWQALALDGLRGIKEEVRKRVREVIGK